jgi:hypothetical protein
MPRLLQIERREHESWTGQREWEYYGNRGIDNKIHSFVAPVRPMCAAGIPGDGSSLDMYLHLSARTGMLFGWTCWLVRKRFEWCIRVLEMQLGHNTMDQHYAPVPGRLLG